MQKLRKEPVNDIARALSAHAGLVMTARQSDQQLYQLEVWTEAGGTTRVDVPPMSQIIDPAGNRMHLLLPGKQVMSQQIGIDQDAFEVSEDLGWLDELREFQGQATLLANDREIDGVDAMDWQLAIASGQYTLWADPADNRPMLLEGELSGGLSTSTRFSFDQPLPKGIFQVPADYQPVSEKR